MYADRRSKGGFRIQTRLQLALFHTLHDLRFLVLSVPFSLVHYPAHWPSSSQHDLIHHNDNMFTTRIAYMLLASVSIALANIDAPPTLTSRGRGLLSDEPLARLKRQKNAPCSPGQYYTTRCKTCTAGYSCPDGQNRVHCGAGAYSGPGATQCTLCPKGTYSDSTYHISVFHALAHSFNRADYKIRHRLPDRRARSSCKQLHRCYFSNSLR